MSNNLRNVAIIAHVDHGKTTLVDELLKQSGTFRENQNVAERVLDSNDQERERGITILSKNTAVTYNNTKINIIDTPGHADFGGEVERVLKMADAALLLVDAFEGPMPQTRFVLKHALALNLKILLVINKIDRDGCRPDLTVDQVFDLMLELGANDEQLDFPIIYASAANGYAINELSDEKVDMKPMVEFILNNVLPPKDDENAPLSMQVCSVDYNDYVGRIATGRIFSGKLNCRDEILLVKNGDAARSNLYIKEIYTFTGLDKKPVQEASAGDIVAVVGIEDADIGDCLTNIENPIIQESIEVEEPTLSVVFSASASPLVGQDGDIVGGRQLKERLMHEARSNISMRIQELEDKSGIEVAGRGILHISVLMESMRREGFEFEVSRPQVLFKKQGTQTLEPIEEAKVETPSEYSGKIIELFGTCSGELVNMENVDDLSFLEFKIPTRGIMGLRTKILNVSHGEALFAHRFLEYGPYKSDVSMRKEGVLVSMASGSAVAFSLDNLQQRGTLFINPGDDVYEGMIVGQAQKEADMDVNPCKQKALGNQRAAGSDKAIILTPPKEFSLEDALEYINDDELVEITPNIIRMRKKILGKVDRKKERARQLSREQNS
ncbi:MAG: translational GTPase TypA [Coriobacteriales bacterium]|nr:translational GTPase TypA [Coriobacteriales bacterium]